MLSEVIMHRMGWTHAWYAHPGPLSLRWTREVLVRGRWMVGVWTGAHNDLLCVKQCTTDAEAETYLSPAAPTVLLACLAALWKSHRLGLSGRLFAGVRRLGESAA